MEKTTLAKIGKISKIAIAIGFGVVICGTAMGPACAGGGHGRDNHQAQHRGGGGGHDRGHGGGYVVAAPNYYYTPAPNYYTAPEPEYYSSEPVYSEPVPSDGINLFFGIR